MMNQVIPVFGWFSFAIVLCSMSWKFEWKLIKAGIWNFWYPMKSFKPWIFYVYKHAQYFTTYQVANVTKYLYMVSLVNFVLLGYLFYIFLGYFCNLFSENDAFMALLCSCYLLLHWIILIFDQRTSNFYITL